jgi:hypothetical protein
MIEKFVKKPIVIEAIKYDGTNEKEIYAFMGDTVLSNEQGLLIPTLEGTMVAYVGDYIIKGIKGEYYPCKPDIFENSYDKAK